MAKCPACGAENSFFLVTSYTCEDFWEIDENGKPTHILRTAEGDNEDEFYECQECHEYWSDWNEVLEGVK